MAFPGRELASVPGRNWQTCPGGALANVPRQGTGKASQAGTAKRAQAGHWQTFPGRELAKRSQAGNWQASQAGTASMPRQGMHTGKRSQAGNWQASQAGTANVPRQGTGKCSKAGNRRCPQAGDSGCSHAGNCRHCKSLATICHQPRGATPLPTSRVLCDELACLLTRRGAIVNNCLHRPCSRPAPRGKIESVRTHSEVMEQFHSFSLLKLWFRVRNWHSRSRKVFFSPNNTPKPRKKLRNSRISTSLTCMKSCTVGRCSTPAPKDATKLAMFFRFFRVFPLTFQ